MRRSDRARTNVEALIAGFDDHVRRFESSITWPGPSLYFHARAIQVRREFRSATELLADDRFIEYVYAVLPAWGMHRMGPQAAKVCDYPSFAAALRRWMLQLDSLWDVRITGLTPTAATKVAPDLWEIITDLKVSTSNTQIVAGSKCLHHLLPDLVPPIDRQNTFRFFTSQKAVTSYKTAFLEWYPLFAEIGRRAHEHITHALARGGHMATGETKIIDNAIIGYLASEADRST